MHTIKITPNLLFEYQCTSGKFTRLPNLIESKKIDSVARIESKLFFRPNWNALCADGIDSFIIKPVNNETQKHLLSEENLTKYVMYVSMFQFLLF